MKQLSKSILLTIFLSVLSSKVYAYDIAVENSDGVIIYYNYINDGKDLEVTYKLKTFYSDNVVIPEKVFYMNRTRSVTSIGINAFSNCSG